MPPKKKSKAEAAAVPAAPLPVQWECLVAGSWTPYKPSVSEIFESWYQGGNHLVATSELSDKKHHEVIDLKKMTHTDEADKTTFPMRRLGNASWEWKDDMGLFAPFYDEDNALIETEWRKMASGEGSFSTTALSFNKGYDSKYLFTFKRDPATGDIVGIQRNQDSGTERELKRNALGMVAWDKAGYGISSAVLPVVAPTPGIDLSAILAPPPTWQPQTSPLQYFDVPSDSSEYKDVTGPFFKTLPNIKPNIFSVKRIQNETLWKFYALTRHRVAQANGGDAHELALFHGARMRENMDAIIEFGFDMRVARSGSVGYGIYFAVNASYSNAGYVLCNKDGSKEMFVCRVAVGSHIQGKHGLKRPPSKGSKKDDLYDSVTNGKPPIMYVVFDNMQAYPEYLIHYKH